MRSLHRNACFAFSATLALATPPGLTAAESGAEALQLFHPTEVVLLEGPFRESLELNARYVMDHDADRLLAPFLKEAGLEPKAPAYGNWESSGLDGHSAGHFLSALAWTYASTGEEVYQERLDYMIAELARCQEAHDDGYVGGIPDGRGLWERLAKGEVEADRFALNGRWVPWYNLHKTFAGLRDAWVVGGSEQAGEILIKLADWCHSVTSALSDEDMQRMLYAEHGGMNDILAELYERTGTGRYLSMARRFSDREILDPLARGEDRLTGYHANTQIPKVIGFQRIAALTDDPTFAQAAQFFWDTVTRNRSVAFGGNSAREHFHDPEDFGAMLESREGPETCNTHNMLRLSSLLFLHDGQGRRIDYYERALFNHIRSAQHPETGGLVYFTPIRPQHYRVYSQAEQAFWCCVGSGIENPGRYTELIYAKEADRLLVNLFIPSEVAWSERALRLAQRTGFPEEPRTELTVQIDEPQRFALAIRKPAWAGSRLEATLNGEAVELDPTGDGYVQIEREWSDGDRLAVELPMQLRAEALPDGSDYYAILYGPLVLAAKNDQEEMPGLFAGDGRMEHIAPGPYRPLDETPILVAEPEQLLAHVEPLDGEALRFVLKGDFRPEPEGGAFILEPFHEIHESRYTMYWQVLPESRYAATRERMAEAEAERAAWERRVIDAVAAGEQQPEVEHGYRGSESQSGSLLGRRYRDAAGWFEYTLNLGDSDAALINLTYWGSEWGRKCAVLVNGEQIGVLEARGQEPERFIEQAFSIPEAILKVADGPLEVRIQALDNQRTPSIFRVALLEPEA